MLITLTWSRLFPYTTLFRSHRRWSGRGPGTFPPRRPAPQALPDCCPPWPASGSAPPEKLRLGGPPPTQPADPQRSEEHTSELQAQSKLVCRLLPETKNRASA